MLKKLTVLAMAVGAVAALALPASASAAWKHQHTAIQTDAQIGLTGNARFQGGLGGVECQITSRAKFLAGQTVGTAETFAPHPTSDTTNCRGLGGLAFCQIHNLTPQAPNWTVHTATATTVSVTTTTIHSQATGGFCPVSTISLTAGTATLTPEKKNAEGKFVADPNTVETASISGGLQAHLTTGSSGPVDQENVTISGHLTVESPNSGTYSI